MNAEWGTTYPPPYVQQPPPPKRRRSPLKVIFAALAVAVAFVIALAIASTKSTGHAPYDPVGSSQRAAPGPLITETTKEPAAVVTPAGPATVITEGQFEVGVDVVAGKYRTQGPQPGGGLDMCYVERARNASGELGSIIANDIVHGPQTITIKPGEFVTNTGCQNFEKIG